jgi:hypothetical protein
VTEQNSKIASQEHWNFNFDFLLVILIFRLAF